MEDLGLYLLALAMIFIMPGPDMILLLQTGARQGRALALATALGLAFARICHIALAAMGLATLFKAAPWTFEVVRIAGAAYLFWLGIRMLKPGTFTALNTEHGAALMPSWRAAIQRGILTNLLNPKALLFSSILLPQFIDPQAGSVTSQFVMLGAILVVLGLVFDSCYAIAGASLGRWLNRNKSAQKVQQWLFGGLLIGFAARLAFMQQA